MRISCALALIFVACGDNIKPELDPDASDDAVVIPPKQIQDLQLDPTRPPRPTCGRPLSCTQVDLDMWAACALAPGQCTFVFCGTDNQPYVCRPAASI